MLASFVASTAGLGRHGVLQVVKCCLARKRWDSTNAMSGMRKASLFQDKIILIVSWRDLLVAKLLRSFGGARCMVSHEQ